MNLDTLEYFINILVMASLPDQKIGLELLIKYYR
jgi:hypothetical protein